MVFHSMYLKERYNNLKKWLRKFGSQNRTFGKVFLKNLEEVGAAVAQSVKASGQILWWTRALPVQIQTEIGSQSFHAPHPSEVRRWTWHVEIPLVENIRPRTIARLQIERK